MRTSTSPVPLPFLRSLTPFRMDKCRPCTAKTSNFSTALSSEFRQHHVHLSTHPSELILVELGLVGGRSRAIFYARRTNANPFGIKCACEMAANTRWKQLEEVILEGKRPMVLRRTFISGRRSRKIALQGIPLSAVVEVGQGARSKGPVERYQFNPILTCCS